MKYGLFDTRDSLWIGSDDGPLTYDDRTLAQCAAQVVSMQLFGTDLSPRIQVKEYPEGPARLRDELPVKYDGETALRRIEGGE